MCSKALDDRLGCTALLGVADAISTMELDIAVYLVASVQEEFNIRGIVPVLRRVKPDPAIGIDITPSCDTPDLHDYSEVRINQGVGITCLNYHGRGTLAGLITPPRLIRMLEQTALEHNYSGAARSGSRRDNRNRLYRVEQDGIPCASLSIPCRYTHSPAEVASLRDLTDCIRLLTALAGMSAAHFPLSLIQALHKRHIHYEKILVACGTGMSTSTMIAHKLQEFLTEQGISATTAQCCLNEIPLNCNGMDLIVTSMRTNSDYGIPTLNGAALLTGINDDALKQQIKALLTQ